MYMTAKNSSVTAVSAYSQLLKYYREYENPIILQLQEKNHGEEVKK